MTGVKRVHGLIGIATALALVGLSGCAGPERKAPAPVEAREQASPPAVAAPTPSRPQEASQPRTQPSRATAQLVARAEAHANEGRWDQAAAALERALRVAPRDAGLWLRLARVRLGQGRLAQAESLAMKAIALAPEDRRLQASSWRLVAEARAQAGDAQGSEQALRRAGLLDPGP